MKKRRHGQLKEASEVLQSLFEGQRSILSKGFKTRRLRLDWSSVVGETLAGVCEPVDYDRGTLWIWVEHPTWVHQLTFVQDQLLSKINTFMQEDYVRSLRFTLDRKGLPRSSQHLEGPQADPANKPPSGGEGR